MDYKIYDDVIGALRRYEPTTLTTLEGGVPLYAITWGTGPRKVLVSGGVHGDEPAGIHAVIAFLGDLEYGPGQRYFEDVTFTILPCVNPIGYENNTRENGDGVDLNREFKHDTEAPETRAILDLLKGQEFDFSIDFHETWDEPDGVHAEPDPCQFYMWEICPDVSRRVGTKVIEAISAQGFQICEWPKIYGDTNNGGVIWYPEDCGTKCYAAGTAFDTFMAAHHTPQAFTTESPLRWPRPHRTAIHVVALQTILDARLTA